MLGILIAFLPAAIIGALAHDFIKTVLFETPKLICIMLILGGVVLLWVDRWALTPKYHDIMDFPLPVALGIGLFQCLALIPGTSRSGATIVGSLLLGADKRSAAEFSFFLAMPTMAGAFVFDLLKNRDILSAADLPVIAIGFVAAFVVGADRRALPARLRVAPRLCAVRLVAADRRRRRPRRPVRLGLRSAYCIRFAALATAGRGPATVMPILNQRRKLSSGRRSSRRVP